MRIDIATLFPEMCEAYLSESILGRARKAGCLEVHCHNIRDYTLDKHNRVDDYSYGIGKGMVMQPDPIWRCYQAVEAMAQEKPWVIYLSPQGAQLNQKKAVELSGRPRLFLLCGHYEGVDQRILDKIVDEEISLGDFVLTGGELPALAVTDAVARMLPGVLPQEECFARESHYDGLLEHPQYTHPRVWDGREVPEVLLSGHHANIEAWKLEESLKQTQKQRRVLYLAWLEAHRPQPEKKRKKRKFTEKTPPDTPEF